MNFKTFNILGFVVCAALLGAPTESFAVEAVDLAKAVCKLSKLKDVSKRVRESQRLLTQQSKGVDEKIVSIHKGFLTNLLDYFGTPARDKTLQAKADGRFTADQFDRGATVLSKANSDSLAIQLLQSMREKYEMKSCFKVFSFDDHGFEFARDICLAKNSSTVYVAICAKPKAATHLLKEDARNSAYSCVAETYVERGRFIDHQVIATVTPKLDDLSEEIYDSVELADACAQLEKAALDTPPTSTSKPGVIETAVPEKRTKGRSAPVQNHPAKDVSPK